MSRALKTAAALAGGLALAHAVPALTSIQPLEPLRTRLFPGYGGKGDPGHVALPSRRPGPAVTPRFLKLLDNRGLKATFFLLGFMLERDPGLGREIAAAGHEIAVHGYLHRPMLLRTPRQTRDDLHRATTWWPPRPARSPASTARCTASPPPRR